MMRLHRLALGFLRLAHRHLVTSRGPQHLDARRTSQNGKYRRDASTMGGGRANAEKPAGIAPVSGGFAWEKPSDFGPTQAIRNSHESA